MQVATLESIPGVPTPFWRSCEVAPLTAELEEAALILMGLV